MHKRGGPAGFFYPKKTGRNVSDVLTRLDYNENN